MSFVRSVAGQLLARTGASRVFTFPGSPPAPVYEVVSESDSELVQGVREQHLLHLAQAHYYECLEGGREEVPLVVASAELGEAMLSQGLLADSISCPCVVLVVEERFPHVGRSSSFPHQSGRSETYDEVDWADELAAHENIAGRVRVTGEADVEAMERLVDRAVSERGVAVVHLPRYADEGVGEEYEDVVRPLPGLVDVDAVSARWMAAERPMLIVGRGAKDWIRRGVVGDVAAERGAMVASTLQVDGLLETNYVGRIGTLGTPSANRAFERSDFVIALGTSLNCLLTSYDPVNMREFREKTIQVEENPRRRSVFVDGWMDASVGEALDVLGGGFEGEAWGDGVDRGEFPERVPESVSAVADVIREERSDAVVTLGVGNSMVWMTYALGPGIRKETARTGSMGEYVGGLEWGEEPIVVVGDGEFEMDLSTLVEAQYLDVSATFIVLNNRRLGMVTGRQSESFGERLTPKVERPIAYEHLGDAFDGVESFAPETVEEVERATRDAVSSESISVVEVPVSSEVGGIGFDVFSLPT